ncbi:hypothetical protein TNCV_685101 [Trichonephila clavipes]|nr:hypothetical protein TNCV_685101 [Trichonephila clavipes]
MTRPNIWGLCPSRRHCFLKPFSGSPPRHQSPQPDGPRQLSHSGGTFMSIVTSRHSVTVDPKPSNRQ